jgi:uncharacterized membrane protein
MRLYRWSFALLWTLCIAIFSYGELFANSFFTDGPKFAEKLTDMHSGYAMLWDNIGLLCLLVVDVWIVKKISRDKTNREWAFILSGLAFVIAVVLMFLAQESNHIVGWLKISYIWGAFLVVLFLAKAETLKTEYLFDPESIAPTKK